ncbi:MAG TPA: prepilin-type N-terminal cleavage/methylation domain-containing protein [Phycisphaerales bacterium]|nr:prepilin-type N-terminal cleavage/methylation domain-containing protein [Phycisphaerales bacterium]
MMAMCVHNSAAHRRAFTLAEIIVVVVIIGILAGVMAPRMISIGPRQAEQEAKAVRSLLTVAADKASVMHRTVAVDYAEATTGTNARGASLTIWVRREDPKAAPDAVGAARVTWEQDRMSQVVELTRLRVAQALEDGSVLSGGKWRVVFTPGHPRAAMELRLEPISSRDGPVWTVALGPDDTAATLGVEGEAPGAAGTGASARTIDLDDAGKGDAKW